MDDPKPQAKDYHEGPEAARRFVSAVKQVVSVSREEYEKRHKKWEKARKRKKARA